MSSKYFKLISPEVTRSDIELHEKLCNPELVTERLGELVPLLKFVGFKVDRITPEKTVLSVPLLETAMNQNGTHQASVFYLLADYTLGVGMFAALPGCYPVGVHDRCEALPVQFWLREGSVSHVFPGTGVIRAEVEISPEDAARMRAGMVKKGRCELQHKVSIYQGDVLVAETVHRMGLYTDIPRVAGQKASLTHIHSAKTSALLIAGLRDDDTSRALAQEQGLAIARRMTRGSPQLPDMVKARTKSISGIIEDSRYTFEQIVFLGVGLDSRPTHERPENQKWFLCDLHEMLKERQWRSEAVSLSDHKAIKVALDFRLETWPERLLEAGFDPNASSLFLFEGVSMYLEADEFKSSLGNIKSLMGNPDSLLWLDHVTTDLMASSAPEVVSFLSSMERLGEPFINPFDTVSHHVGEAWKSERIETASDYLDATDPLFGEYKFSLISPSL